MSLVREGRRSSPTWFKLLPNSRYLFLEGGELIEIPSESKVGEMEERGQFD